MKKSHKKRVITQPKFTLLAFSDCPKCHLTAMLIYAEKSHCRACGFSELKGDNK